MLKPRFHTVLILNVGHQTFWVRYCTQTWARNVQILSMLNGAEVIKPYSMLVLNSELRLGSHAQLRMRAHGGYNTSWDIEYVLNWAFVTLYSTPVV